MKYTKIRCALEDQTIPWILFLLGTIVLVSLASISFIFYRFGFAFIVVSQFFILAGVYYPILFAVNKSIWSIVEDGDSVKMIRDGNILYHGSLDEIKIADENRGIINFTTINGNGFIFPRRRIFNETLSKIESI